MIDSLLNAFKMMLKTPVVILVAIVGVLVNMGVIMLLSTPILNMIFDVFMLRQLPDAGFLGFPLQFIAMYPDGMAALFMMFAAFALISLIMAFFISRYVKEIAAGKGAFGNSLKYTISNALKILGLFIFFFAVFGVLFLIMWLLMAFSLGPSALTIVFMLLFMLFVIYLAIKLVFTVSAMAIDELPARESIRKSWEFSAKSFWGVIALIILVMIISMLITALGINISMRFYINDLFDEALFIVFTAIASVYSYLAFPLYYLKKEHQKTP